MRRRARLRDAVSHAAEASMMGDSKFTARPVANMAIGDADDIGSDLLMLVDAQARGFGRLEIRVSPTYDIDPEKWHPQRWGESVAHLSAEQWRAAVHNGVPERLRYLKVPHAFTVWRDKVDLIHRMEAEAQAALPDYFGLIRACVEVRIVADERGAKDWVTSGDVNEAALRLRGAA